MIGGEGRIRIPENKILKVKFIEIENIRIAYREINPDKKQIIFFIHGNSGSSKTWEKQFNSELFNNYRLIAFDLPAHGQTDSVNGTPFGYSLPDLGKIMATAIIQLADMRPYILAGVSLGTNIIAEMLVYDIQPAGIVLTGSCVIGGEITMDKIFKKDIDLHAVFADYVPEEELKKYFTLGSLSFQEGDWINFAADYYKVKDNFRSKMIGTVAAGNLNNEIHLLQKQPFPLLVIFGEEERVCDTGYLDNAGLNLWRRHSFKVKDAGHYVNIDQPEKLSELMMEYARDMFTTDAV